MIPAAAATDYFNWTGFYVGVNATSGQFTDGGLEADTTSYGLQAGYLYDIGRLVIGGELSHAKGEYSGAFATSDFDATRFKLIGGYDAGRLLPYAFVGASNYTVNNTFSSDLSDTVTIYGIGARVALGSTGRHVLGLEYMVEDKDSFDNNFNLESSEVALRYDFRF